MNSNDSNNDVIQQGRKKVYSVKEKLELLLPDGKNDGILEIGDLVYVVQKYKVNGKDALRFKVMKFADSKKESTIYSAENTFFEPHFEKKDNVDGDSEPEIKIEKEKPTNYSVPAITSIIGGGLGYMFAERFQKNKVLFAVGGLAIGVTVGIFILKSKKKK